MEFICKLTKSNEKLRSLAIPRLKLLTGKREKLFFSSQQLLNSLLVIKPGNEIKWLRLVHWP